MEAPCVAYADFSQDEETSYSVRTGIDFEKERGGEKSDPENSHLTGAESETVEYATLINSRD
jgi:hypothetical protein